MAYAAAFPIQITPVVPTDITGGAEDANVYDAAVFAWQEFIALNWPALTEDGLRDVPDTTQTFGDPNFTGPLVWHTYRHKSEIFPGSGNPMGYDLKAADFGYSTLPPVYRFEPDVGNNGIVPACGDQTPVAEPSLINLDETTQIGLNYMFAGDAPTVIDPDVNSFPQAIRFLAQGNQVYYEYVVDPDALTPGGDALFTHPKCPMDEGDPGYDHTYCVAQRNFKAVSGSNGDTTLIPGISVEFPAGTILVKGAFRELNADEAASGRFYTTTVRYYEDIPNTDEEHCYWEREWGLVGLHIIHKTPSSPNFVFATFEQVDNLQTAGGHPIEHPLSRFYDPGGEQDATEPALIYTDSLADGPALTIDGDETDPADYCQPEDIGDRLFYLEIKDSAPTDGYICQNHRDHPLPVHVRLANAAAQNAIRKYLNAAAIPDSPFLYYRLVNVQPEPYDKTEIQNDEWDGNRSSSIYYLANIMVETDYSLQHFSGRLDAGLKTDYPPNFDNFGAQRDTYQNVLTFDGNQLTDTDNMGGCMGCHGVAQNGGNDFSFVLGGGRVTKPEAPEIDPPGTSNPPPGDPEPSDTEPGDTEPGSGPVLIEKRGR